MSNAALGTYPMSPPIERWARMANQLENEALRAFVKAVAEATQTHPDFVLMNVLGVLSTALNGKLRVEFRSQTEPVQLYLLPIAESGERKSAVVRLTQAPIQSIQKLMRSDEEPENGIYVDDITPAALAQAMANTGGRAAVHSPEGESLLRIMGQSHCSLSIFCKAYDAEDVRRDRVGKKAIYIPNAAMSICLSVQPRFAIDFARVRAVLDQGLLARFLMVTFPSLTGQRQVGVERIAQSLKDAYEDIVIRLWRIPTANPGTRHPLELTFEAQQIYTKLAEQAEYCQGEGNLLAFDRAWGSKFCGKVLRVAAILHCVNQDEPLEHEIDAPALRQAIGICDQFRIHAEEFYSRANDEVEDRAQEVLKLARDWAARRKPIPSSSGRGEFSAQDVLNNTSLTSRQAKAAIERLLQTRRIVEDLNFYGAQCMDWRRGRKQAPRYVVADAMAYMPLTGYLGGCL